MRAFLFAGLSVWALGCGLLLEADPRPGSDGGVDSAIDGRPVDAPSFDAVADSPPGDTDIGDAVRPDTSLPPGVYERLFEGTGTAEARDIAVGAGGDVFVTGSFGGTLDLGMGAMSSDRKDCFLARFSPDLDVVRWAQRMGGPSIESCVGIALTPSGGVIVVGHFDEGPAMFGSGSIPHQGDLDGFITEWDAGSGAHRWSVGVIGDGRHTCTDAVVADDGYVCVTGQIGGGTILVPLSFSGPSGGSEDAYLACLAPGAESVAFLRRADGASSRGRAIAMGGGHIYVAGDFGGTIALGSTLSSRGGRDGFVTQFDLSGVAAWSHQVGGPQVDRIFGVAARPGGDIVISGVFEGTLSFGPTTLAAVGNGDAFVGAIDHMGVETWATPIGSPGLDIAHDVALVGGVATTGAFDAPFDFAGRPVSPRGGTDMFAASFEANGVELEAIGYGGVEDDIGWAVALAPPRGYVAGSRTEGGVERAWLVGYAPP